MQSPTEDVLLWDICMLPIHCELTLTYNRHTLMQRSLYNFLNQDYEGMAILLIFNTGKKFELGHFEIPQNRQIILINDQETDFKTVGEKYTKALTYLPQEVQTVNAKDDDDSTLPFHISQGVKGLIDCGETAWKPAKSYFHTSTGISLESNVFEGSIFILADHLRQQGFHSEYTVKYHDKWLHSATVCVDYTAPASFIYDWGQAALNTYKMSGRLESDITNFEDSQRKSLDVGNGILIPSSQYIIKI